MTTITKMTMEHVRVTVTPHVDRIGGPAVGAAVAFSFCTLMTDRPMYDEFRRSMQDVGFGEQDCEYLAIDNSTANVGDGYRGLNALLNEARGAFVVLCHQDLLAIDSRKDLDMRLSELDQLDPTWAVAGNAGGRHAGEVFLHVTGVKHGEQRAGILPKRVFTLDENFIVTRRDRRVALSADLSGFHLYGSDICMVADVLGYSSYVIDFHLKHLGSGGASPSFLACREAFKEKWSRFSRQRAVQTPCTFMFLDRARWRQKLLAPVELSYYRVQKKIARRRIRAETRKVTAE